MVIKKATPYVESYKNAYGGRLISIQDRHSNT